MTALGTLLAVGVFVAVVGLTATANGQISQRFTELVATQVDVEDVRRAQDPVAADAFPDDADRRTQQITGVRAAGLWWIALSILLIVGGFVLLVLRDSDDDDRGDGAVV